MVAQVRGTTGLHLALAWGFVGIPLAWGVVETVLNALKLFQWYAASGTVRWPAIYPRSPGCVPAASINRSSAGGTSRG